MNRSIYILTALVGLLFGNEAISQVSDVNGDGIVGPHEAISVAENWKGPASESSNNHDHLGQTWTGEDNPLRIQGNFPPKPIVFPFPKDGKGFLTTPSAPLILNNTGEAGNGLVVYATDTSVFATSLNGDAYSGSSNGAENFGGRFVNTNASGGGVYASGGFSAPDLALGGDRGVITANDSSGSVLQLISSTGVTNIVDFDDTGSDGNFSVIGGDGVVRLFLDDDGNLDILGNITSANIPKTNKNPAVSKTVLNGSVQLDEYGEAEVELPDFPEDSLSQFHYQLTALDAPAPELHVAQRVEDGRFKIAGGKPGMEICWQVTGAGND